MAKISNCHHIMNDIGSWETKYKSCNYSNDLLEVLSTRNKKVSFNERVNILEIKKAIYYAKKYHGSQMRLSGEPFYTHPIAVASMVSEYVLNTDILVTSILHDTIEDTVLTKEMINHIFGLTIANNVEVLTRIKSNQKISAGELVELLCRQEQEDLLFIKYFDRLHNLQTINFMPPEKILKTVEETFKNFSSLSVYLATSIPELFKIHEELLNLCYQKLSSIQITQPYLYLDLLNKSSQDNFQLPFLVSQNKKHQS